jgi:hypothetical protein
MLTVGYEKDLGQICGRIDGELNQEVARHYFKQVAEVIKATNCNRVLTDVRLAKLNALEGEMEDLSAELVLMGITVDSRRAILLNDDIKQYKTWENYCFRNGYKSIRLFMDEKAANAWLLSDSNLSMN